MVESKTLATIARAPEFDWKPMNCLPNNGKFLLLNVNRRHGDISIGTVKVWPEIEEDALAQQLKWAVAWEYFPELVVKIEPAGGSGGQRAVA